MGLRGWLEARRTELEGVSGPCRACPSPRALHPRPWRRPPQQPTASPPSSRRGSLVDAQKQTAEQRALSLLAALLDWHRRDAKPAWWEYFARRDATDDELIDDASSVGGLVFDAEVGVVNRSRLFRFLFPPQETKLRVDDAVEDPRTYLNDAGNRVTGAPAPSTISTRPEVSC